MSKVEVITGAKRQTFTPEERARIVDESYQTNETMSKFCKRMGIAKPTLSQWRKKAEQLNTTQIKTNLTSTPGTELVNANFENSLIQRVRTLEQENLELRDELHRIQAFLGRKIFESETRKLAA